MPGVEGDAEDASPVRRIADREPQLLVDPGGDERADASRLVDHRDGAVAGTQQRAGAIDDGLQDGVEREVGGDHEGGGVELQELAILPLEALLESLEPADDLIVEEREEGQRDGKDEEPRHPRGEQGSEEPLGHLDGDQQQEGPADGDDA